MAGASCRRGGADSRPQAQRHRRKALPRAPARFAAPAPRTIRGLDIGAGRREIRRQQRTRQTAGRELNPTKDTTMQSTGDAWRYCDNLDNPEAIRQLVQAVLTAHATIEH